MAQVDYNPVPSVLPNEQQPNDYIRVNAEPSAFGGAVAQGLEKLSAGADAADKFWGEVQTDDAQNNWYKESRDAVTNFLSKPAGERLKSQDALNTTLDGLTEKWGNTLGEPRQRLQFDSITRAQRERYFGGQIASASISAAHEYARDTNENSFKQAMDMAATAGSSGNEATFTVARAMALDAQNKQLMFSGTQADPNSQAQAITRANMTAATYTESLMASGPDGYKKAKDFINRPDIKPYLIHTPLNGRGQNSYDELSERLQAKADYDNGSAKGLDLLDKARSGHLPALQGVQSSFAIGDSVAQGAQRAANIPGVTTVGIPPAKVIENINNLDPQQVAGRTVWLSTGLSNDTTPGADVLDKEVAALEAKGVSRNNIIVGGLGTNYTKLNEELRARAKDVGVRFADLGPNDGVHATDGYKTFVGNLRGGAPAARASAPWFDVNSDMVKNAYAAGAGFSPGGLTKLTEVESVGNPRAVSPTGYRGLTQFGSREWAQYGTGDINDPAQNLIAAQKLAAANRSVMEARLGRKVTDAELYLAHQEGAAGAVALLSNPDLPAGSLVPAANIRANGGDANMPARAFTQKWIDRFERAQGGASGGGASPLAVAATLGMPQAGASTPAAGTPQEPGAAQVASIGNIPAASTPGQETPAEPETQPAQPAAAQPVEPKVFENPYATALQSVLTDPNMNKGEKAAAIETINKMHMAQQLNYADEERAYRLQRQQQEQASENAENKAIADLYSGKPVNTVQSIANNRDLTPAAKLRMTELAAKTASGAEVVSARASHAATNQLFADLHRTPDDPQRITGTGQIIDAFAKGHVNKDDFNFLMKQATDLRTEEGEKLASIKSEFLKGYEVAITKPNALSGVHDPLGDQNFYRFHRFVEDNVDAYVKEGKNPADLFNPSKPDYLGRPATLQPFVATMKQTLDEQVRAATQGSLEGAPAIAPSAPPPAQTQLPERPQRRPGESFSDFDQRVRDYLNAVKRSKGNP